MVRKLLLPENMTRDHETLEFVDNTDGYRCPVCEDDFFDSGPCNHIVTTFAYSDPDEGGWWCWDRILAEGWQDEEACREVFGDMTAIEALPEAVERLLERLPESDLEAGRLPASLARRVRGRRLRALLDASVREREFDRHAGDEYLLGILRRSRTYVGWMTLTTSGMGSSSFDVHYAREAIGSAARVVEVVAGDIAVVESIVGSLPPLD